MTIQLIDSLIDKHDNFEIVRDQIAGILVAETVNQQSLAVLNSKNPDEWKFDVYTERSNPWSKWLNNPDDPGDTSPIVNVSVDTTQYPKSLISSVGQSQGSEVTYNIDCYAYGVSSDDDNGHVPGDEQAGLECARIARLIRNILISSTNTYLQLRGVVSERWVQSITFFQSPQDTQTVQNVRATRIILVVRVVESSPQVTGLTVESIFTSIKRASDGKILFDSEINIT